MPSKNAEEIALVLGGFERIRGVLSPMYVGRALNDDDDPLGYEKLTNLPLLDNAQQQEAFSKLPPSFTHKEAMQTYGRSNQPTTDFLKKCVALGILRKTGKLYEKLLITGPDGP